MRNSELQTRSFSFGRRPVAVVFLLVGALSIATDWASDIHTKDGNVYRNATVTRVEPDGIVIMTNTGVIKLNFSELPKELQQKYGYDPAKAAAFVAAEADKRARQQQAIVSAAVVATPQPTAPPSSPPQAPAVNTPARPPADAPASVTAGLVLDKHWETTVLGGGSEARRDLGRLLSRVCDAQSERW